MSMARGLRALGLALLAAAVVATASACEESLADITPEIGVDQVAVQDDKFSPRVIQITRGTEVTWTWDANRDHNVVGEGFQSELQREGTFSHTFTTPGSFRYLCTLHGGMTGAVIVTE